MAPIRKGDGTQLEPNEVIQVRKGDGTVLYSAIPDSGVSRWTFDDNDISSGTLADSWNGYDGTIDGMATTTGIYPHGSGEAGNFDGTDDRVSFGELSEISGVSQVSVAVWANLDVVNGTDDQMLVGGNPDFDDAIRLAESGGQLQCLVENNGTRALASGGTFNADTTYLCVLTFDSGTVRGYLDETEVLSQTGGPSSTPAVDIFAGYLPAAGSYTDGLLDDARVYDKQLTATEVSNLYNTGSISG